MWLCEGPGIWVGLGLKNVERQIATLGWNLSRKLMTDGWNVEAEQLKNRRVAERACLKKRLCRKPHIQGFRRSHLDLPIRQATGGERCHSEGTGAGAY